MGTGLPLLAVSVWRLFSIGCPQLGLLLYDCFKKTFEFFELFLTSSGGGYVLKDVRLPLTL